jgi:DNA-binding CsgD family transcriptional regulator
LRLSFLSPRILAAGPALLHPGLGLSDRDRRLLPSIWNRLLASDQLLGMAIEDSSLPADGRIVGMGLSAFLHPAFTARYLAQPTPYPSLQVYRALQAGMPALLPPADVARASASGDLTVFVLHYGQNIGLDQPRGMEVLRLAHAAFRFTHEGFGVGRVLQEGYGEQLRFLQAGGMLLESDYASYYAAQDGEPPPELRPYLCGLDRADAEAKLPGTTVAYLFQRAEPRFGFSPAEQRVLLRALIVDSEHQVATELGLSPNTLKKVWRSIYQRVERVDPSLLPASADGLGRGGIVTRGREKRRVLLDYLRGHMEELRPFAGPDGKGSSMRPPAPPIDRR